MFTMFNQAFTAISVLFQALESFAKTILNLTTIGEEMSGSYKDEQSILRIAKRAALNLENNTTVGARVPSYLGDANGNPL